MMFDLSRGWLDDYATTWRRERVDLCQATRTGEDELQARTLRCLEERRQSLDTLVVELFAEADRDIVTRSVSAAARLPAIAPCNDPAWLARSPRLPADEGTRAAVADLRRRIEQVAALQSTGKFKRASEEILAIVDDAETLAWPPLQVEAQLERASLLIKEGAFAEAEKLYEETLWFAASRGYDGLVGEAAAMLTYVVGHLLARPDDGLRWGRLGTAALERSGELDSMRYATLLGSQGIVHEGQGDYEQAQAMKEETLALRMRLLSPDHPAVANANNNLAVLYLARGQTERAEEAHLRALDIRRRSLGPNHPEVGSSLLNLGNVYGTRGDHQRAYAAYSEAQTILAQAYGERSPQLASIMANTATSLQNLDRLDESIALHRQALEIRQETLPPHHPELGISHVGLGTVLLKAGKSGEGIDSLRRGAKLIEEAHGTEHIQAQEAATILGEALVEIGDRAEGFALINRVWALCEASPPEEQSTRICAQAAWLMAHAKSDSGELEEARALADRATADFRSSGLEVEAERVESWLAEEIDAQQGSPEKDPSPDPRP